MRSGQCDLAFAILRGVHCDRAMRGAGGAADRLRGRVGVRARGPRGRDAAAQRDRAGPVRALALARAPVGRGAPQARAVLPEQRDDPIGAPGCPRGGAREAPGASLLRRGRPRGPRAPRGSSKKWPLLRGEI